MVSNRLVECVFITTKTGHLGFSVLGGSELSESGEGLTTHGSANFEIISQYGFVGRWSGDRDFGGRIGAAYFNNGVAFVLHSKNSEKTINFAVGIGWPDSKM